MIPLIRQVLADFRCRSSGLIVCAGLATLTLPGTLNARMPTRVEDQTPREYWQFLFLYESTSAPGQEEYIWHPFYGQYTNAEKAYEYRHSFYPLYYGHGTNYWHKWSVLYFLTGEDK